VLAESKVREAITTLIGRRTHPLFVAYLHLRQVAAQSPTGSLTDIQPVWTEVSEVLRVPDAPSKHPHLRPFWSTANSKIDRYWLNDNLAGSFAPSSLRGGNGIVGVVFIAQADKSFTLLEGHVQAALTGLLFDQRMPVHALAAFLLRDHGFINPTMPIPDDLIPIFRERYGVADDDEFNTLYDTTIPWGSNDPWFVQIETGSE
jgi:hypothetical protein